MGANNDIARIGLFLESAESERTQLSQDTGSIYNTSKRIDNFLLQKSFYELQKIKDNLYQLLDDPFLPEKELDTYMKILEHIG